MMNRRLAVIDLDGTLLDSDKQISPENRHALQRLRDAGFEIVFASGRHHGSILCFEPEIGTMSWLISSSGAVVRHAATDELLHELTLLEADSLALRAAARAADLTMIAYHRDGIFMETETESTRAYAKRAGGNPQRADLARLAASGIQKVMLSAPPEILEKFVSELESAFARLYVVRTEVDLVEFHDPRVNKAAGTEALARKLAIERADVFGFGDGNNDVELLAWAGFSVAMAHGQPRALQAARRITPPGPPETAFARAVDLALATLPG